MKVEAQVVLTRCKNRCLYGIRVEKYGQDWKMTWAFPIDEKKATSEGYAKVSLKGSFLPGEKYNGCPYCHTDTFLVCERCGKLSCYQEGERVVTCQWCGNSGTAVSKDEVIVTGGDM